MNEIERDWKAVAEDYRERFAREALAHFARIGECERYLRERNEVAEQLRRAVDRADALHEEFSIFVNACGHCLAGGRPPNAGMIDAARITLNELRGR